MDNFKMFAPCIFGTEGILSDEIKRIGISNVNAENGRVNFEGDLNTLAAANMKLRTAERVLINVGSFKATTFEELFQNVKKLDWSRFIGSLDAFPVAGYSISSELHSVPDCQSIIKKAIVESLKVSYRIDWFDEIGPVRKVRFSINKDSVLIGIDTSGDGLHKRGYRENSTIAPIKETLAASMCYLSGIYPDTNLYDPFCGSGTILIESAMIANNIAPGTRRFFAAERFGDDYKKAFADMRTACIDEIKHDSEFRGYGSDILPDAVELTLKNARLAGVADCISAKVADVKDFTLPDGRCTVITNPPYGERLLDVKEAEQLYKIMGEKLIQIQGKKYFVISSDDYFEKCFGRTADKRRKLYNGMLKCQYYMYFRNKKD